ncbi:MAG: hypothetical protein AAB767_04605 [Patescibacteria group bacterium]
MSRKNCLIKLSGDCLAGPVLEWILELSRTHFVVICVGGGTQIKEAFAKAGFPSAKYGPLGRETKTFPERQLARDVLEQNQADLQNRLAEAGIPAVVVIPVLEIGSVLCHVNGDQFVLTAYLGFGVVYVVTLLEREAKKKELFAPYPTINVICLKENNL